MKFRLPLGVTMFKGKGSDRVRVTSVADADYVVVGTTKEHEDTFMHVPPTALASAAALKFREELSDAPLTPCRTRDSGLKAPMYTESKPERASGLVCFIGTGLRDVEIEIDLDDYEGDWA